MEKREEKVAEPKMENQKLKKEKWEIKNKGGSVYLHQNLKTEVNALAFSFTRQAIQ